jgi:prevent-host-death family protein
MAEKVSTMDVRARIGDMLNRVALRHDEFIIERKGKPLAALVPVGRLEQMRQFARRQVLEYTEFQRAGLGNALSDEEAMAVALDAQRIVRRQLRKGRPGSKRSRK